MDRFDCFPEWLDCLLRLAHDSYSSRKRLSFFCITCLKGVHQENLWQHGAESELDHVQNQHTYLQVYHFQQSAIVKLGDLVRLGVHFSNIQTFEKPNDLSSFIFLLDTSCYVYIPPSDSSSPKCAQCRSLLHQASALFCCLDCKFRVLKDAYVPPWPAYEENGRFSLPCDSTNQVKNSISEFLSKNDPATSFAKDGNLVHQNTQGVESNSKFCSTDEDPTVNGTDSKDKTSSGKSTCKPLGESGIHVPKAKFVGWWKDRKVFSESWIGKVLPLKNSKATLLPNYQPMVQEEPCCLTACGICLPSEETRKDHESDLEDHIYCLLEEGCAGLGKFELGKPSLPVRPKSDLLVAATLNPRLWWPT